MTMKFSKVDIISDFSSIKLIFTTPAVSPPVNVEATQASDSAPVEISWSPPSDGSATITAYRIYYGNGENVSVPSIVTSIILSLNEDSVGQIVSLRSEADQLSLSSELINVTVTHSRCSTLSQLATSFTYY